jgi:hypothetical protein
MDYKSKMKRIYTNGGQNISTKITSAVDGKKFIVSAAKDPRGSWQLAVFKVSFGIPYIFGWVNHFKPLRAANSQTFAEAEKKHFKTEGMVDKSLREVWQNWG